MAGHIFEADTIALRDGIELAAKVFRPSEGQAPTLLMRIPYGIDDTPCAGNCCVLPNLISFLKGESPRAIPR
jgi:predicted acyl esterase